MVDDSVEPLSEGGLSPSRRVLLVEDVPPLAQATAALLSATLEKCVVDIAHTAAEVMAMPLASYELVFLDINVPGATGLSLVNWIADQGYAERTCLVTQYATREYIETTKALGFRGYIGKWESLEEFRTSVQVVMKGRKRFPQDIAESSLDVVLTEFERSILALLKDGHAVESIAAQLNSSAVGIKRALRDIKLKLNVRSQREMLIAADMVADGGRDDAADVSTGDKR